MVTLTGADLVLPDRVAPASTLVIDAGRIVEILPGRRPAGEPPSLEDLTGHLIVPGFVDGHVHGVAGHDALDGAEGIAAMAGRLPRYGVTAFCPTTIACTPAALGRVLAGVRAVRERPVGGARVLPAHLESSFISYDFRGAQPAWCIRMPPGPRAAWRPPPTPGDPPGASDFDPADLLAEIERARGEVGIVTLAPELPGALDLVTVLTSQGLRVSLGHSAASYEDALAGIEAGACRATHLFNRMGASLAARVPGLAAAALTHEAVAVEIICDGVHVHPAMVRLALAAKGPSRTMAITDGTAGAGLPRGSRTRLGGRPIIVRDAAYLDDGTMAGSVLTMDRAFRLLVETVGLSLVDAALVCATTPAAELGRADLGRLSPGAAADLVVLDRQLGVVRTYVAGEPAYTADRRMAAG
jgi:N-acetylglucosamine-6-phosphate deacetylase